MGARRAPEAPAGSRVPEAGQLDLGPLADNGGEAETHLPLSGSIVIDAIPEALCNEVLPVTPLIDQRAIMRPQGSGCDAGSVEAMP